jgi:hypothetical protein
MLLDKEQKQEMSKIKNSLKKAQDQKEEFKNELKQILGNE